MPLQIFYCPLWADLLTTVISLPVFLLCRKAKQIIYVIVYPYSVKGKVVVSACLGNNNCLVNENIFSYAFSKKIFGGKSNENCCNLR